MDYIFQLLLILFEAVRVHHFCPVYIPHAPYDKAVGLTPFKLNAYEKLSQAVTHLICILFYSIAKSQTFFTYVLRTRYVSGARR